MGLSAAQRAAGDAVDRDAVVALVQQLIRVPGITDAEDDIVQVIRSRLTDGEWHDVAAIGDGNVFGVLGDGPPQLLYTVYVDSPPAGAMREPYDASVLDGAPFGKSGPVVRGRGACTKGTLGAMIVGAEAARLTGGLRDRAVAFAATTHDERGMEEVLRATGLRPNGAIVGEPTGNAIGVRARGITWLEGKVEGRPTHRGIAEGRGNPIGELADLLPALRSIRLPSREDMPPAMLTPIGISHDGVPPRTPYDVRLRLDRRTLPGETSESVAAEVHDVLDRLKKRDPRFDATVRVIDSMRPFEADAASTIVTTLDAVATEILGQKPEHLSMPFGTNAGCLRAHGVPAVAFGPALIADRGDEEHVEVAATVTAARIFASLAAVLAVAS